MKGYSVLGVRSWVLGGICALLFVAALAPARSPFAPGDILLHINVQGRGEIVIKLFTKEAPRATAHIIALAKGGFYNGQRFYRVIRSPRPYLVQLGAPDSRTRPMDDPILQGEGTGTKIPYEESGYSHDGAGMVGLSHQATDKNSGDSQFYVLLAPAKFLDGSYTVFGKVVQGMSVLQGLEKGDTVSSAVVTTE